MSAALPRLGPVVLGGDKLERFSNWLLQAIATAPTRSLVVRGAPEQLHMTGAEVDAALRVLREQCVIACSNGRWWTRDTRAHLPPIAAHLRVDDRAPPKRRTR